MQPGDLVRTTRTRIGVPKGTIGLILRTHKPRSYEPFNEFGIMYYDVQLNGLEKLCTVRRMQKDLELVESWQIEDAMHGRR